MAKSYTHPETIVLHAGYRRDRDHACRGGADLPDHLVPVRRYRSGGAAVRAAGVRQHLHAHHESDHDVLEQRVAALEGGVAALALPRARRRSSSRFRTSPMPATTSSARPISMAAPGICSPTRSSTHGHRGALRRSGRSRRLSPAPPTPRPAPISPRRCPTRSSKCFRSPRSPRSAARFGVPLIVDNTAAPILCGRSSMARRSWCIRPPNISAATAPRSAA